MKTSRLIVSVCLTLGALVPASCASDEGPGSTATPTAGAAALAGNGGSSTQTTAGTTSSSNAGTTNISGGSPAAGGVSTSGGSPVGGHPAGGTAAGGSASGGNPAGGTASGGKGGKSSGGDSTGGKPNQGDPCSAAGLTWKSANKTNFESYPDPGSEECVKYNGCMWAGQFAFCDGTKPEDWVSKHDIVAVFPQDGLENHDICIKQGNKTMVVTVLDTCGDSDCDGCCTENLGSADRLIDLEKYTNERWGLDDGKIQWADLGPNDTACD
jgi:hypothetical protein